MMTTFEGIVMYEWFLLPLGRDLKTLNIELCSTTIGLSVFNLGCDRYEWWSIIPLGQILAGGVLLLPLPSHPSVHHSILILSRPLLRDITWQWFHIFNADHSYMEPLECQVILTFSPSALKSMTVTLKMSGPLLWNYKWQLLHILRTYWYYNHYLENVVRAIGEKL